MTQILPQKNRREFFVSLLWHFSFAPFIFGRGNGASGHKPSSKNSSQKKRDMQESAHLSKQKSTTE